MSARLEELREYLRRELSFMRRNQSSWNREVMSIVQHGSWAERCGLLLPPLILLGMGALIWWGFNQSIGYGFGSIGGVVVLALTVTAIADRGGIAMFFSTLWTAQWSYKGIFLIEMLFQILFWPLVLAVLGRISWEAYRTENWPLTLSISAVGILGLVLHLAISRGWFKR